MLNLSQRSNVNAFSIFLDNFTRHIRLRAAMQVHR